MNFSPEELETLYNGLCTHISQIEAIWIENWSANIKSQWKEELGRTRVLKQRIENEIYPKK